MSLPPELASQFVADSHTHLLPVSTTVVIGGAERCVYILSYIQTHTLTGDHDTLFCSSSPC